MATRTHGDAVWNRLRTPFWNATEGRIRAFWRVLGALGLVLVGGTAGALAVGRSLPSAYLGSLASQVVYAGVATAVLVAWARYVNQAGSALALGFWVLAGLVMGLAYLLTDGLALPYEPPTLVRPAFSGPEAFVEVAGAVNTAWLLVVAAAVVAFARLRNGSVDVPFATEYGR
ncbi:MAG: hypothetical protein V5A28_15465 [Haloarculaceae archaeon]